MVFATGIIFDNKETFDIGNFAIILTTITEKSQLSETNTKNKNKKKKNNQKAGYNNKNTSQSHTYFYYN